MNNRVFDLHCVVGHDVKHCSMILFHNMAGDRLHYVKAQAGQQSDGIALSAGSCHQQPLPGRE